MYIVNVCASVIAMLLGTVCLAQTDINNSGRDINRSQNAYIAGVAKRVSQCHRYFELGVYDKALSVCRSVSIDGNAQSKYILGKMYLEGLGVEENRHLALGLIRESAQLGITKGARFMAESFEQGTHTEIDLRQSCDWWSELANNGEAKGQEKLGVCYLRGKGRKKNMKLGYAYLSLAANNGRASAQYILETYADRFPESAKKEALLIAENLNSMQ